MVRSIRKDSWFISYHIHGHKIIQLLFLSKNFEYRGWSHFGSEGGEVK